MMLSRQALSISIFYSVPLLLWFSAQLQFIDWNTANLQHLFKQTLIILILLQTFSVILLFTSNSQQKWQDDLLAIFHILLFPLPFMALIWLTGSTSLSAIINSLVIVGISATLIFVLRVAEKSVPDRWKSLKTGLSSIHILLAVFMLNFGDLWQGWLE